jgi:hypothetical protein
MNDERCYFTQASQILRCGTPNYKCPYVCHPLGCTITFFHRDNKRRENYHFRESDIIKWMNNFISSHKKRGITYEKNRTNRKKV